MKIEGKTKRGSSFYITFSDELVPSDKTGGQSENDVELARRFVQALEIIITAPGPLQSKLILYLKQCLHQFGIAVFEEGLAMDGMTIEEYALKLAERVEKMS